MLSVNYNKLAIHGGKPILSKKDIVKWCPVLQKDREAIKRVLDQNEIAGSNATETVKLQQEWSQYIGVNNSILTNSGTAALHMAVASLGIKPGDEVIVPSYTFVASATSVLHHNAIPVFADIEKDSLFISIKSMEKRINSKTKAIIVVHLNGMPAPIDKIISIAKKYNLKVIEDACQAHGAEYNGKKVGSFGDVAAFSLNKSKNLPAGEGGIFVTNSNDYFEIAKRLCKFGEIYNERGERDYNAYGLGWMYRSTEFVASFARSRLKYLNEWNQKRRENVSYLNQLIDDIPGIKTILPIKNSLPAYWRYMFKIEPEELNLNIKPKNLRYLIQNALIHEGLLISQWQKMIVPKQTLFINRNGYGNGCPWSCDKSSKNIRYDKYDYPNGDNIVNQSLWLKEGIQPFNSIETIEKIGLAIRKVFENIELLIDSAKNDYNSF
ncbi:glutamine--scyllo-inositol aminotransferase [Candidatus Magnetomorum sp. HK-1]|nr:glutamine--scyllo-inositol aminotransferase [Candidatus Magnetomorum sp. HK-1]